jgi:hypothetical protein
MENKERDYNLKFSPRADSFVDNTTDDAMESSTNFEVDLEVRVADAEVNYDDDNAMIKCVCGFGKGFDDDNCAFCEGCETWQHTLCYFLSQGTKIPGEDEWYRCVDCEPSSQVDAELARNKMSRKLKRVARLEDQIHELTCEIRVRDEEIVQLQVELEDLEDDLYRHGPKLDATGGPDTDEWYLLDILHDEWCELGHQIFTTRNRRRETQARMVTLEMDLELLQRNEPTITEQIWSKRASQKPVPVLFTTAESLGLRCCQPRALPPVVSGKGTPAVLAPNANGKGKVAKVKARPKAKKRRTVR